MSQPATSPAPRTAIVNLTNPILRGETEITQVTLREPKGGDLRGLSIQQLNQSDYNAVRTLVPRISVPPILETDFDAMPAADIAALSGEVLGFFMSPAQLAAIEEFFTGKTTSSG